MKNKGKILLVVPWTHPVIDRLPFVQLHTGKWWNERTGNVVQNTEAHKFKVRR